MKLGRGRFARRRIAGLMVPLLLGLLAAGLLPLFDAAERATWDARFVHRGAVPPSSRVVLVEIDRKTVSYAPWLDEPVLMWGDHFASALRHLKAAGASVVGIDMIPRIPTQSLAERLRVPIPWDQVYAQALAEFGNYVFVTIRDADRWVKPPNQLLWANSPAIEADNLGVGNFQEGWGADPDCVVRAVQPMWHAGTLLPCFGIRVAERYLGHRAVMRGPREIAIGSLRVPLHRDGTLLIHYAGPPGTLTHFSFCDIAEGRMPQGFSFRGKVVLIGESFAGLQDLHLTPFARGVPQHLKHMPGVEVWGNVVATLLDRQFLAATELPAGRVLVVILALAFGAAFLGTHWLAGAAIGALGVAGWHALGAWLFSAHNYLLLTAVPVRLIVADYVLVVLYRYFAEEREKRQIKSMWGRYLNPAMVEHVLQHPEDQGLGGKRAEVTVLFSDIRGFTSMAEHLGPGEVVQVLNDYFTAMSALVVEQAGIVDKYVGDALMAVWGVPRPAPDGPERAVRTALGMLARLDALNQRWQAEGRPPLQIGVGINTGAAVFGNIGSPHKMDLTVVGDTVNVASRLEAMTKDLGVPVLITEAVLQALPEGVFAIRPVPATAVRGRDEAVRIYAVDGLLGDGADTPPPTATTSKETGNVGAGRELNG